ncbi:DUF969 domain-containing protein [Enterococcus phoeniculicola]|uniref:Permease n=1 Tax=Enterococcus phoeniculicola ATCC BAA-412 TaxID=1158610 RepID=R3W3E3_9ENTE|nr:DUF969 domain-containing protein [Enterococcus phoeniculicola]EOL41966.1 hypothetical protein UC3_02314 [Enterococcus phoeniculicola ATCC BAA-412]EOT79755.1 hypothetical protein I589_01267 [Enterococcus phoeniculicola ATCC BAA-412]
MEWIKLIGILIILVGFIFKFDTIAVVIIAALATALVSGISIADFFTMLGEAFVNNRLVTIFLLTLPMIGLSERFGLRQQAVILIQKIKGLTPGKFLTLYTAIREIAGLFGIRISGHPQFVRPIVNPMAQAAAKTKYGEISEEDEDKIKARAAANENYGNFFAQNTFVAASGVLLIAGTLKDLNYDVSTGSIARMALLVALIALVLTAISNMLFDRRLAKKYGKKEGDK